ncbi:hypothetical protein BB561_003496 [Smittium simulii]|uniref:Uncharacterized protein n=1 Tax=Smittium simulii TaxID=133385 RepID=A0A2T9YKY2_9FUNG|nr:hypothetical protein BB561_003497 [Smittium simulii]PVU92989.1 hypothetical protein BB561_003496 [Smittium simulii]
MRFTLTSLILAASSILSVASSAAPEPEAPKLEVRSGDRRGRGRRIGYFNHGRVWRWDDRSDDIFIRALRYRPSVYYGQRFQYCYQYIPDFRRRWDTDIVFRGNWNRDLTFRNRWFGRVRYNGWRRY